MATVSCGVVVEECVVRILTCVETCRGVLGLAKKEREGGISKLYLLVRPYRADVLVSFTVSSVGPHVSSLVLPLQ